jgi:hypothetical protein
MPMIEKYVYNLADQMGIQLSEVSLTDGSNLGCKDVHMLNISTDEALVSTLLFRLDILALENGNECPGLELKMRKTLLRLQNYELG